MAGRSSFGHIRQRSTGRWQARWQDPTGRQHSASFDTKRDAAAWLRDEALTLDAGRWVDPRGGKVLLSEWCEAWLSTVVDVRESTRERDAGYLRRYVLPAFGATRMADIDHAAVTLWVADLNARLAPATVVKAAQILGKVLRAAVAAKMLRDDPTASVRLPRIERHEMRFLGPAEVDRLADAIDHRWRAFVLLGAYSGLRLGEMLGLQRRHVDIERGRVDVVEVCTYVAGRNVVGPPKTRAGRRSVSVPRFVCEALEPHLVGDSTLPAFPAPRGGYAYASNLRAYVWHPAIRAAALDGLRIHDLRHTAVALWLEAGASPVEVARRAGHTSTSVVLDRYGHRMAGSEDRVTAALERLGRPALAPVVTIHPAGA